MSAVRYLVLALCAASVSPLHAQATTRRARAVVVPVPDLTWIGPVVAEAQAHAAVSLAQVRPTLAELGPAMAAARVGLMHAEAALASTSARMGHFGSFGFAFANDEIAESPPAAWAQQDPADQIYRDARKELNRGRFATAADLFAGIYKKYPRSTYAGDAYYWQAYALSKRDNDESLRQALSVLKLQKVKAEGASSRRDAEQLRIRICGELAKRGDADCAAEINETAREAMVAVAVPTAPRPAAAPRPPRGVTVHQTRRGTRCDNEDDTQSAALNALLQMDGDKALPILKKVLARRDEGSVCLRRKAVFLVSQHEGPETERILLDAARTDPDGEVREQAVQWLSQVDSPAAVAALDSILRSADDPALQDKAIFALSQQDSPRARQALKDFALRAGVSSDLRQKAIFWIGQGDDPDRSGFLKTLYSQLKDQESREKILFSMSQIDGRESQRWLLQVAGDVNENIELRKKALFWVGQSDIPATELFTLYERMPSREMKEQLIFVYSQRDERAAVDKLFDIAQKESDRELRKKAIFWLGQSDDPRVPAFLERLLDGKPN